MKKRAFSFPGSAICFWILSLFLGQGFLWVEKDAQALELDGDDAPLEGVTSYCNCGKAPAFVRVLVAERL